MVVRRRYNSPIRTAMAEETRTSLLEAAQALLTEEGVDALSIPRVAQRVGVSAPTAYKYFPTVDDLMRGLIEHVRPLLGLAMAEIGSIQAAELPALSQRNFRRFERYRGLISSVVSSPTWNRLRLAEKIDRAAVVVPVFSGRVDRLSPRELRAALGALYLFVSPQTWRWLRETWGLSAADASRAATWAISVLARELWTNPPSIDPVPLEERP